MWFISISSPSIFSMQTVCVYVCVCAGINTTSVLRILTLQAIGQPRDNISATFLGSHYNNQRHMSTIEGLTSADLFNCSFGTYNNERPD